jgi:hypothetical protein
MQKTTNYGFNKPESTDFYNIEDFNENADLIDEKLKAIEELANPQDLDNHKNDKSNPHGVTAAQVGLGNVPNVATNDQTPTYTVASENTALSSGEKLSVAFGKIAKAISTFISHIADATIHHSHSNKTVLDNTTASYTTDEKTKLSGIASGANAYTHPNSGVTAGTYRSVTVNAAGHVTGGTNPTVTVAQGGTGATTFSSGQALIGAGTGAVTTRAITNNTATTTAITASTNLVTMNTLKNVVNRTTGIGTADTNYGTSMVRAISAGTSDLTAGSSTLLSGAIYIVYE